MMIRRDIQTGGRTVTVLGTYIIGPDTVSSIHAAIEAAEPDAVVVDYDATRWSWLAEPELRKDLDLVQIIKNGELPVLNSRLAFSVMQKRLSPRLEVSPDAEILAAAQAAEDVGAELVFGRRPVEVEGVRAWRAGGLGRRIQIGTSLVLGSLKPSIVDAQEADDMRSAYHPDSIRDEMRLKARSAAPVIFDEADLWLCEQVRAVDGDVVVVMNATGVQSVVDLLEGETRPVEGLDVIPEPSLFAKALPWLFSAAIIAAFVLGFIFADFDKMMSAVVAWCISNASLAALGSILAAAHPWTVLAVALTAPFVSLNPAVGAGMVGAFVQALVAPPSLRDMESVGDDVTEIKGWWRNRLSRILLIFVFANVSSSFGSVLALAWFPT